MLTRQIAQHTRHTAEPTTTPAPARDDIAKNPVQHARLPIMRDQLTQARAPAWGSLGPRPIDNRPHKFMPNYHG